VHFRNHLQAGNNRRPPIRHVVRLKGIKSPLKRIKGIKSLNPDFTRNPAEILQGDQEDQGINIRAAKSVPR